MKVDSIGSFLTRIKDQIEIKDSISYKRVTIKTNHKGIFLRDIVVGSKIELKTIHYKRWKFYYV